MFKKSAWLAGVLAACFLSLSAMSAAAGDGRYRDGGHRHGGHGKYDKWDGYGKYKKWDNYGKHHGRKYKQFGHRHSGKHHGKYHGQYRYRHYGQWPQHAQRRSFVYDDGHCRVVIGSGPYGHKKIVRCGPSYPVGRYIPGSLIHTHPPAVPGQVLGAYPIAVSQVLEQAPDGQGIVWDEPQTGNQVEIVPTRSYQEADGRYCREYQSTATVAGRTQQVYGLACRQPDGTWAFVQ
jgi:hypothetical protein